MSSKEQILIIKRKGGGEMKVRTKVKAGDRSHMNPDG
jgi:hypothetical protein